MCTFGSERDKTKIIFLGESKNKILHILSSEFGSSSWSYLLFHGHFCHLCHFVSNLPLSVGACGEPDKRERHVETSRESTQSREGSHAG